MVSYRPIDQGSSEQAKSIRGNNRTRKSSLQPGYAASGGITDNSQAC